MIFNQPLSPELVRRYVEIKYSAKADHTIGWSLRDDENRTQAWHPHEPGSTQWASADDAFRSFVPDSRRRHFLTIQGWTVERTEGITDLTAVLHTARGEAAAALPPAIDSDDALFDLPTDTPTNTK